MAKCDICGKGVTFGIKMSHSHRRSNRTWKPNVRKVKAVVNGSVKSVHVCTRCLRSGKVQRAVWFLWRSLAACFAGCFFHCKKLILSNCKMQVYNCLKNHIVWDYQKNVQCYIKNCFCFCNFCFAIPCVFCYNVILYGKFVLLYIKWLGFLYFKSDLIIYNDLFCCL